MKITYIGMATVLIEIGGTTIITDPVLDPKGTGYTIGKTNIARYVNEAGPALSPERLPPVDLALVSHDQHKDNLDRAGRALLQAQGQTLTTVRGAQRLRDRHGVDAVGLAPWDHHDVVLADGSVLRVTATPARHGPPVLASVVAGPVVGFVLEWSGFARGAVYLTGDTRLFRGVREVARRFPVGTVLMNLGAGRFSATGPACYSMPAEEGARAAHLFENATIVPLHFDGWSHLSEGREAVERAFVAAGLQGRTVWLPKGRAVEVPS